MMDAYTDPGKAYGLAAVVAAVIGLAVAFNVPLTVEQQHRIVALIGVAGPAVTAWAVRRRAWAPASVDAAVAAARAQPPLSDDDEEGVL